MEVVLASPWRSGWAQLLVEAGTDAQLADPDVDKLTYRVVAGRLALTVETADGSPTGAEARGVVAATWALSGETCAVCGGPGDPVELAGGERSTLCGGCRGPGAAVLPREWRTAADAAPHAYPTLKALVGAEDLAALMDARHAPAEHRGWPVRSAGGSDQGLSFSATGYPGWNHLVRAALALLLPDECAGAHTPWRLAQLKEQCGQLVIIHAGETPFRRGVSRLVATISRRTCIFCGRRGQMAGTGWMHPSCERCRNPRPVRPPQQRPG